MGTIGPDPTDTLFSYLPPVGWADVATVRDVRTLGVELHSEIAMTRSELKGGIAGLRSELKDDIAGLRGEFDGLRSEFKIFRSDLTAAMHRELRMQFYWTVTLAFLIMTLVVAIPASGVFE